MQTLKLDAHLSDPRFASYAKRKANEDTLLPLVEPAIRQWKAADLEAALMAAGVPCARVNDFAEVFDHPQIKARGVVKEVEHPRLGTMRLARNPILFDHGGPEVARPAPTLGEHSEEILKELGYGGGDIQKLVAAGVTKLGAGPSGKAEAAE
jgi:crotonobetainyl-CoA:carnitine CoA-transferase CaiB-like acyl-CoA transferase